MDLDWATFASGIAALHAHKISISNLVKTPSAWQRLAFWCLDRLLGIAHMNQLYHQHQMQGLSKEAFCDKLIALLNIDIIGIAELQRKIPRKGPLVIASNHPFGGIEGVILARLISEVRPDLKVLANKGLGIFQEIKDYFIFTNPLSPNDAQNAPSLRTCLKHVQQGHALLIFPAGKVSSQHAQGGYLYEHAWNKLLGRLIAIQNCAYLPIFVAGKNSTRFYRIERIWFKSRMLMLGRELLNKHGQSIKIGSGNAVQGAKLVSTTSHQASSDLCQLLSYAQDPTWQYSWPQDKQFTQAPLIGAIAPEQLMRELRSIPSEQRLLDYKSYSVYFSYQAQTPLIVREIARLREQVFREHNEGSGEALDSDKFDATYTHLFIVDHSHQRIIGAYRMGLTDQLQKTQGKAGLYLHNMFEFADHFMNQRAPCMEMGRSFLIPEMQGSHIGLLLLWKGIGHFAVRHPEYRTLYGTVSISKLYDARSVKLIEAGLIRAQYAAGVKARHNFDFNLPPNITQEHLQTLSATQISAMVSSIEADGKDIPVLAKQYLKMGAKFHALGIDVNFNHTPGLLLSVHLPSAPEKFLKQYCGEQWQAYRDA